LYNAEVLRESVKCDRIESGADPETGRSGGSEGPRGLKRTWRTQKIRENTGKKTCNTNCRVRQYRQGSCP